MSYYCESCDRYFKWRVGLKRHLNRKVPCRKALFSCTACKKVFVSKSSLKKHVNLYCKEIIRPVQVKQDNSLSSLLDALYNNEVLSTPKNDFLDNIKVNENEIPPTPALVDETFNPFEEAFLTTNAESTLSNPVGMENVPSTSQQQQQQQVPSNKDSPTTTTTERMLYFDTLLSNWMNSILQFEGKIRKNNTNTNEVEHVINRMLEDGLISSQEYNEMIHVNKLFIRLHEMVHMDMLFLNRTEMVEIVLDLYELRKIGKEIVLSLIVQCIH